MTSFEDRIGLAMSLALSRYEARTYLALLELGEAKAARVATASKVPRGRIYEVLGSLEEKGLVVVIPSNPRQYRATPPTGYARTRSTRLRAQAEELEHSAKTLASLPPLRPQDLPGPTGEFFLVRKRPAVIGRIREMIEGAREEILISSTEACAVRARKVLLTSFQSAARVGVDARLTLNITEENLEAVRVLDPFIRARHNRHGNRGVTVVVIDREQTLMSHWNPDDSDPFVGEDAAIWSNDRSVAESLRFAILGAWEQGVEMDARAREIETGEPPERTEFITGREEVMRVLSSVVESPHDETWVTTLSSTVESHGLAYLPLVKQGRFPGRHRRMLVGHDGGALDALWEFAQAGVEVRITPSVDLGRHLLVDRAEALSFIWPRGSKAPDGTNGGAPEICDLVVRTTARDVVKTLCDAFELEWARAIPLDQYEGMPKPEVAAR